MKKYIFTGTISILFLSPFFVSAQTTATSTASSTPIIVASTTLPVASSTTATTTVSTSTINAIFTKCQQMAIEKRDASIATARTTYNQAMAQALLVRTAAEKALVEVTNTEEKKEALKKVVETYRISAKAAQTTLTNARKATWVTFENDTKACRDAKNTAREKFDYTKKTEHAVRKEYKEERKEERKEFREERKELIETRKEENKAARESFRDMVKSLQQRFFHN